jgi:hypothetical protein
MKERKNEREKDGLPIPLSELVWPPLRRDLANIAGRARINQIRRNCGVIIGVPGYHSDPASAGGLSPVGIENPMRFDAGLRSGGILHAEARPVIAVDHGDIGALSSMRSVDGHQAGRTSSDGVEARKAHLRVQGVRSSANLCPAAELTRDRMRPFRQRRKPEGIDPSTHVRVSGSQAGDVA